MTSTTGASAAPPPADPTHPGRGADPDLRAAEAATRERLLRSLLREAGTAVPAPGPVRLPVPGPALTARVTEVSPSGHHGFAPTVTGADGTPVPHRVVVEAVLDAAGAGDRAPMLVEEIADSTARTARYLAGSRDDWDRRSPEQSLLRGHPFHPTPKSAVGFTDEDLLAYAPELGAEFRLDHVAVDPELVVEHRVAEGDWGLEPAWNGWPVLPVHPWQVRWLIAQPRGVELLAAGRLRPLGPRGPQVRPTSSVRTVAAVGVPSVWKLPLGVRITHFVRTNPAEHVRRALAAGALVTDLDPAREHPGFEILVETGARGVDPGIAGPDLADGLTVLFRDAPRPDAAVLAGLLEDGPDGQAPALAGLVRAAGGDTEHWVRRHVAIAILPLLRIFDTYGIGFEAHVQNSLLVTRDGLPHRFQVRDMEGTHVARDSVAGARLEPRSELLYDRAEAWQRLRYHVITNHLAHLLATLARVGTPTEAQLWATAAAELAAAGTPSADALTTDPTLPAKANLAARVGGQGERPDYVEIPNPLREATR